MAWSGMLAMQQTNVLITDAIAWGMNPWTVVLVYSYLCKSHLQLYWRQSVSNFYTGSFHGNSYRRTLSSLKRGNSEDHPPTPPPRTVPKRPSVSDSDNIDDEILVGTHEIQAQIEALKKGGLLPQRSYSQMDEQPLSPRRRPLRGTMSGGE